ncbi:MAG: hypothetical protein A2W01_06945 [Candidatus Solincola sediminis]|uniref:N-acetyltransferase domain-containing protein n=1 Tax=Candidatus Solincola sediminis TaxID=1797199 RepID=A0A1F2WN02_9ACTN|nr:MAG: hypothetical protein A2W01_06945 [Candidatus Solincola sediminis]OFW58214.1 MAG: hypothetical protein A2Y75_08635 [Candidatus Solincola sediminis]
MRLMNRGTSEVMVLKVIPAEESHIPQVIELWKELMDFHRGLDGFYSRKKDGEISFRNYMEKCIMASDCLALVAIESDEVAGYSISTMSKHPPVLEIESYGLISDMAVKAEHRRQGIGSAMLMETLDWFASSGVDRIELHAAATNPIGNSFWIKHGFKDYEHILYLTHQPKY